MIPGEFLVQDGDIEQNAGRAACETEGSEIQHDARAVDQHAERGPAPASDPQGDQGDAAHASQSHGNAGQPLAQQHPSDERRGNQQRRSGRHLQRGGNPEHVLDRANTPAHASSSNQLANSLHRRT